MRAAVPLRLRLNDLLGGCRPEREDDGLPPTDEEVRRHVRLVRVPARNGPNRSKRHD